ncbi:hypothetical protein [uncultured Anaerobiospirillum sp.]|uniref:hypothetical protein n=1 Tax=uncultured Anaerobiospirillum sp. TaxID=265728 RepID=UPI0028054BCA|nr:hypothetical protein [uncultured Anaerobiospirillum sp.]
MPKSQESSAAEAKSRLHKVFGRNKKDASESTEDQKVEQDHAGNAQDHSGSQGTAADDIELVECEIVADAATDAKEKGFGQKIAQSTANLRDHITSGFAKTVKKVKVEHDSDLKDRSKSAVDADAEEFIEVVPDNRALVVVHTKEELNEAQKSGAERILVKGELGKKLHTSFKALRSIGSSSLNTLALVMSGAALFAPFTGGVSLGAAGTVMGTVGAALTATAIAAISAIGLALVIAVFKGYEEVRLGGGGMELVIKKGKKKDGEPGNETTDTADEKAAAADQ